jgi:aminomethyltransferase
MSVIEGVHADHEATFTERDGQRVVADYGRPERTHRAVRNVAGTIEMGYDIRIVTGPDRVSAVDDALTAVVPEAGGQGTYGFILEDGGIAAEVAVYNAAESDRLLAFCTPGRGAVLEGAVGSAATVTDATEDLAVFGVHGPQATEKIASVLSTGGGAPEPAGAFTRGTMGEEGVTVIATDAPTGEEGYEVVCDAGDAKRVFDTLVNRGLNAAPFGYRTWASLTLEAGTPLFSDIQGRDPAVLGGDGTGERLLGLTADVVPESGAGLLADGDEGGDEAVGTVTRALESPRLDEPIALAVASGSFDAVETEAGTVAASEATLPFVEGSARSGRIPEPDER